VAGDEQDVPQGCGLRQAEIALLEARGKVGQDVLGGVVHRGLDEPGDVAAQLPCRLGCVLRCLEPRVGDAGVLLEELVVLVGHSEQLTDHQ
jgi:hypothetical protein